MEYPQVFPSMPEARLFTLLPPAHPNAFPPPEQPASLMHPFNIPASVYQAALDPKTPATIAIVYAITVKLLTRYNQSRNKQPWAISKTKPFFAFVVLHNIFLAVYSAWTFWGMLSTMRKVVMNPWGPTGWAGTVDSFCHLQGKPGLGNSAVYRESEGIWRSATGETGLVSGQMGRIWNEGLSYYGWIFYMSKFYEVLDTFIILAKGKPSSTLQTYHHTGAMLCMWAGIRYMSAPIWIFVQFNSFIHALMYTYYTLSAFNIRVPMAVKRSLTSLQISQFIIGASSTIVHSCISYVIPMTATTAGAKVVPSYAADNQHNSGALKTFRQLILGDSADNANGTMAAGVHQEVVPVVQPCITTSGETFGIWLNILYLAPLTYLFVSFFIASYMKRSNASHKMSGKTRRESNVTRAEKAGWDAARSVEKEMYGGERMINGVVSREGSPKLQARGP